MILHFACCGWPEPRMVRRRLDEIRGLDAVELAPDGRTLTLCPADAAAANEAMLRLRELGWRRTP